MLLDIWSAHHTRQATSFGLTLVCTPRLLELTSRLGQHVFLSLRHLSWEMHLESSSPALHRGREWGSLPDRVVGDKAAVSAPQTDDWSNAHGVGEVDEYLVNVAKLAGDNQLRVHNSYVVSRFVNMLRSIYNIQHPNHLLSRSPTNPSVIPIVCVPGPPSSTSTF